MGPDPPRVPYRAQAAAALIGSKQQQQPYGAAAKEHRLPIILILYHKMPPLSSLNSKNISAAKMNKKYDSCAAHITRVATNVDF